MNQHLIAHNEIKTIWFDFEHSIKDEQTAAMCATNRSSTRRVEFFVVEVADDETSRIRRHRNRLLKRRHHQPVNVKSSRLSRYNTTIGVKHEAWQHTMDYSSVKYRLILIILPLLSL